MSIKKLLIWKYKLKILIVRKGLRVGMEVNAFQNFKRITWLDTGEEHESAPRKYLKGNGGKMGMCKSRSSYHDKDF